MQRPVVHVARMRIRDLQPGDIVNKDPDSMSGWFEMVELRRLHDGNVTVAGRTPQLSFSGQPVDICGVQRVEPLDIAPNESPAPLKKNVDPALSIAEVIDGPQVPDSVPERWAPPHAGGGASSGGPAAVESRALV